MWSTPEGVLAEDVGQGAAFKAEIVADKNVRKVPPRLAPPCAAAAIADHSYGATARVM